MEEERRAACSGQGPDLGLGGEEMGRMGGRWERRSGRTRRVGNMMRVSLRFELGLRTGLLVGPSPYRRASVTAEIKAMCSLARRLVCHTLIRRISCFFLERTIQVDGVFVIRDSTA